MRSEFFPVEKWEVLMTKNCYYYDEDNTPFKAVCVRVGTLYFLKTSINGVEMVSTPIIRWFSEKNYNSFNSYNGAVIF
jgi:hypothetical protein